MPVTRPPSRRAFQLAGALQPQPQTPQVDQSALRRKAMIDALDAGMTAPIQGDGSGLDWVQGLARGGEAFFRARSARDDRQLERDRMAAELARQRAADEREANKPISVSPGETLLDPTTMQPRYTAPDSNASGPIRAIEGDREIVMYDTRTGEEVGRRPIAPRPVGAGSRNADNRPPWARGY